MKTAFFVLVYVKEADPSESVVAVEVKPSFGPLSTVNVMVTPALFSDCALAVIVAVCVTSSPTKFVWETGESEISSGCAGTPGKSDCCPKAEGTAAVTTMPTTKARSTAGESHLRESRLGRISPEGYNVEALITSPNALSMAREVPP